MFLTANSLACLCFCCVVPRPAFNVISSVIDSAVSCRQFWAPATIDNIRDETVVSLRELGG